MYTRMKKALRETQTLRAGCSKAEPKIFTPPQTTFLGAQDGKKLISWRWSLPSPTDPVWWTSIYAISSYHGNRPTNKPTNKQTHRQDWLQYTAPQLARSVKSDWWLDSRATSDDGWGCSAATVLNRNQQSGAISRAKLHSNRHHQQTNTQLFTGRMPFLSPKHCVKALKGKLSPARRDYSQKSVGNSIYNECNCNEYTNY